MKEQLLIAWKQKYERIQWELEDNQKKLENVIKRQNDLLKNIYRPIVQVLISLFLLLCLWLLRDSIMFMFYELFCAVILGLAAAAVIYFGYRFMKAVRFCAWHRRKWDPVTYPKPEIVKSNYPTHIPPNYYAERICIEWLLRQYNDALGNMLALRQKIENAEEEDLESLVQELENILIYERVGRARNF